MKFSRSPGNSALVPRHLPLSNPKTGPEDWPLWVAYGCAVSLPALTLIGRFAFGFHASREAGLILFTVGIVISAYLGGPGPGILATVLSAGLAAYYELPPAGSFRVESELQRFELLALLGAGASISFITGKLRRSLLLVKAAQMRFSAILNSAMDAIITIDEQQRVVLFNPAAEQMFVCSAAGTLGQPIERFIPDRFREAHAEKVRAFGRSQEGRRKIANTVTALRTTGDEFPAEASISHTRVDGEHLFSVILRDVTARERAEEALRQSEERFSKAFRNNPLAMTISIEKDGRYIDCNEAFVSMTGYSRFSILGKTATQLGLWQDVQKREERRTELAESERILADRMVGLAAKFTTAAGEVREGSVSTEEILVGGVPCTLEIIQDVTETKRLERQFFQAQKMEAVGRLAAGIAHDLNNILSVILGHCELAAEHLHSSDAAAAINLDRIRTATQRAASLNSQLLAFSRQRVIQPRMVDLNQIVSNLNTMITRVIGEDITLKFKPTEPLGSVRADVTQMEQILLNLIVNSRDAMPKGGEITIETANVELDVAYSRDHNVVVPGSFVLLSVADSGAGMDENTKAKIFEPFFTTKPVGKGTGLGLATVYGIVKQHGGYIWVYSELGKGTTFKIYLPRVPESPEAIPLHVDSPVVGGSEVILLVEDDTEVRNVAAAVLRAAGYNVLEATDSRHAMQIAQEYQGNVDLLLTDLIMPKMNAPELFTEMQRLRSSFKLLYMSGYPGELAAQIASNEQPGNFIEKPFTRDGLLRKVRNVLDDTETTDQPGSS